MSARKPIALMLGMLSVLALAQAWKTSYDKALKAAQDNQWALARDAFKEATVDRPEDEESGGPAGPFSPNFGAAYAAYRMAQEANGESSRALYLLASQELEVLVGKRRASTEAMLVLARCYEKLDRPADAQAAEAKSRQPDLKWKADVSFLSADLLPKPAPTAVPLPSSVPVKPKPIDEPNSTAPEKPKPLDKTSAKPTQGKQPGQVETTPGKETPKPTTTKENPVKETPAKDQPVKPNRPSRLDDTPRRTPEAAKTAGPATPQTGPVPVVANKFALIIGNSQTSVTDLATAFGVESAAVVRDALLNDAGYDAANVVTLTDANSDQIRTAAMDLAKRVPEGGVVFLYFAGVGVNVDGKDYLAGTDTSSVVDTRGMVPKAEIMSLFVLKGARIFAFYECNRPQINRSVFGQETMPIGSIAQTYGTVSGQFAYATVSGGKSVGLFARSVAAVLKQFRSNAVPVSEFVWEVFYNMKRGGQAGEGGGSLQTPTLPDVRNMPSEARF